MELKERSILSPHWETEVKLAGASGLPLLAPDEGDSFPRVCGERGGEQAQLIQTLPPIPNTLQMPRDFSWYSWKNGESLWGCREEQGSPGWGKKNIYRGDKPGPGTVGGAV